MTTGKTRTKNEHSLGARYALPVFAISPNYNTSAEMYIGIRSHFRNNHTHLRKKDMMAFDGYDSMLSTQALAIASLHFTPSATMHSTDPPRFEV